MIYPSLDVGGRKDVNCRNWVFQGDGNLYIVRVCFIFMCSTLGVKCGSCAHLKKKKNVEGFKD